MGSPRGTAERAAHPRLRAVNPPVADHILRSLLGSTDAPNVVEISDIGTRRFELVARGVGLGVVAVPREALLGIPGVIYRRVEDPASRIDYGLLWFDDHVSPALPAFLDLARKVAYENPVPANGRFPAAGLVPA